MHQWSENDDQEGKHLHYQEQEGRLGTNQKEVRPQGRTLWKLQEIPCPTVNNLKTKETKWTDANLFNLLKSSYHICYITLIFTE